eukprot:Selendium_serpulae@DN6495_c1_g1_i18.p1
MHSPIYQLENIYPAMAQGSQGQADTGGSVRRAEAAHDTPQTPDAPIPEKTTDTTIQEPQSQHKSDETPQPPEDPKPETPSEDEPDDVLAAGFLKGIKKM